ncbi:MAG TPA: GNAT family N-acetyltransferase [Bryobacteraceae bacterium]|nr:GNAT family N-acetyltransferase [Bryobacteraceae bacterium]
MNLDLVDIRRLGGRELSPLLLEETGEWNRELDWDFSKSADLVRKFADSRGLGGAALMNHGEPVGYGYTVLEDHKGLIGDVYVRREWRGGDAEIRLFRTLLDGLIGTSGIRRIESQLMLIGPEVAKALQRERFVRLYERLLMNLNGGVLPPGRNFSMHRFRIEPWADHHHDSAARVISLAYGGHIDSQINDQYRTFDGARKFLYNIVQFPGCGAFHRPASFVGFDLATGWVAGMVLSSFVADDVAHITQLCVTPYVKGFGLGYELLRRAVTTLRVAGAKRVSLTVTGANEEAVRLYRRCGFQEVRRFYAYVWEAY